MKIQQIELSKLKNTKNNVKFHNNRNIESIKTSLKKFGQYSPLIVSKNNFEILKGVGTYLAMKQLNWKTCQVYFIEVSQEKENELIVLDNRTSELSQFDNDAIEKMLYDMNNDQVKITGFNDRQVQKIMNKLSQEQDKTEKNNLGLNEIKCPYCGNKFSMDE